MSEDITKNLTKLYKENKISKKYLDILLDFYKGYKNATISYVSQEIIEKNFKIFFDLLSKQANSPYKFELFHKRLLEPFNYQKFGVEFLKPLVDLENSNVYGFENLKKIQDYINKKDNVILLANHQSEVDPLLIYLLLEKDFPNLASDIICIAGERVITDPLAIPFSLGCNLLCIYSKRYIDIDLKLKHQKQIHNKKVMSLMSSLLSEGGKIIYVAPSGGRDRKDIEGKIKIAPFDPQSLEMFYLMCKKAKTPSHFFPLTLDTYNILPPPEKIQIEMGEKRIANRDSIFISFSNELDMEHFPGQEEKNKIKRRKNRAQYIHNIVKKEYEKRTQGKK
jgi:glycerol-3-phosphate O-acyltransferase